jgi:hypothetical protein
VPVGALVSAPDGETSRALEKLKPVGFRAEAELLSRFHAHTWINARYAGCT